MDKHYDDTFLARWMNGELSDAEQTEFEASESFPEYRQIIDTLNNAEYPSYDLEKGLRELKASVADTKKPTKKGRLRLLYTSAALAAGIALLFAYLFFFGYNTIETGIAQSKELELPDGSKLVLNSSSVLSYKKFNWTNNRELELKGEAYLEVNSGSPFLVITDKGSVEVLGTKFKVNARTDFLVAACYEGQIAVNADNQEFTLDKGKSVYIDEERSEIKEEKMDRPSWLNGESSFIDAPILQVLEEMERQYPIKIIGKEKLRKSNFSGRFSHDDFGFALKTVFGAMDIPYTIVDGNIVIEDY